MLAKVTSILVEKLLKVENYLSSIKQETYYVTNTNFSVINRKEVGVNGLIRIHLKGSFTDSFLGSSMVEDSIAICQYVVNRYNVFGSCELTLTTEETEKVYGAMRLASLLPSALESVKNENKK